MKLAAIALVSLLALFALVTWWALEAGGVAIVETRAPDGTSRFTHVWFAEPGGELWLEAGTPDNPWFLDIQRDPGLSFSADARSGRYTAHPVSGPASHKKIRSLLRQKYGARDWWVGLLVDTSGSVAVRLSATETK